jgi:hypothetical protein
MYKLFEIPSITPFFCAFYAFLWLKNPFNHRNPRYEIRSTKVYVRKNNLFMQNEPKFRKVKFNVNDVLTADYDKMDTWSIRKNEPKTNPNEPNLSRRRLWRSRKQTQFHMILAYFSSRAKKMPEQIQNKAKQTQFQAYGRFRLWVYCELSLWLLALLLLEGANSGIL